MYIFPMDGAPRVRNGKNRCSCFAIASVMCFGHGIDNRVAFHIFSKVSLWVMYWCLQMRRATKYMTHPPSQRRCYVRRVRRCA